MALGTSQRATPGVAALTRAEIEDFLYHEADLLDAWQLEEWLGLLSDDVTYEVPPTDAPEADSANTLFLVSDNAMRVRSRVEQLLSGQAWSEAPKSRTRRFVSNVRIRAFRADEIDVTANFCIHRFRAGASDVYVGRYEHVLVLGEDGLRIKRRRAILDMESLRPHGKVSIIL